MKKQIKILCVLAAALFLLAACGAEKPAEVRNAIPLADKVNGVIPDEAELAPLVAEDLEDMLGITAGDYREFVFLQSEGTDGREVLVIRAADSDTLKKLTGIVEEYLKRRLTETRNYAPEAYRVLSEAKVQTRNLTVALVVGPDGAKETEAVLAGE